MAREALAVIIRLAGQAPSRRRPLSSNVRRLWEKTLATEIERKFLVTSEDWRQVPGTRFSQGYLNRDKERTVRVRVAGDRAFLTVKGLTHGASRAEFEYEVPLADGEAMLALCDGPVIEKVRRVVVHAGHSWEVDEFMGENTGLVVAEIELESADQEFTRPKWLGAEVTNDPRYFNSNLAKTPYRTWREERDA